jgi:hypothetical protein
MIPKSVQRFSDQIMRSKERMIPKSGCRFSDQIVRSKEHMIANTIMRRKRD